MFVPEGNNLLQTIEDELQKMEDHEIAGCGSVEQGETELGQMDERLSKMHHLFRKWATAVRMEEIAVLKSKLEHENRELSGDEDPGDQQTQNIDLGEKQLDCLKSLFWTEIRTLFPASFNYSGVGIRNGGKIVGLEDDGRGSIIGIAIPRGSLPLL